MYYIKKPRAFPSIRRKIQIATWDEVGDPTCYGSTNVWLDKFRELQKSQKNLDLSHVYIKAIGEALNLEGLNTNGIISFGIKKRKQEVDVMYIYESTNEMIKYVLI